MKKNKLSRRRFLSLTSKAVCAGLVAGIAPLSRPISVRRNAALIGYGQRGFHFWQQTILPHLSEKIQVSAICEPDPAKETQIPYHGQFRIVRDAKQLLSAAEIDTLIITSPDNSHTPLIQRFLSQKQLLVCELPLAISKEQYRRLSRLTDADQSKIHPVRTQRLHPVWKRIKALIDQNVIGDVLAIDFHIYHAQTNTTRIFREWQGQPDFTGSWLIHEGTRHFDLVNWWLDQQPVAVSASGKFQQAKPAVLFRDTPHPNARRKSSNWNSYTVQVKYENNIFLNYSLNGTMPYDGYRLVINGVEGQIESRFFNQKQTTHPEIRIWNSNGQRQQLLEKNTAVPGQLANELWHQLITDDKAFENALSANLITIEATNSIIRRQPIRLENNFPDSGTTEFRSEKA